MHRISPAAQTAALAQRRMASASIPRGSPRGTLGQRRLRLANQTTVVSGGPAIVGRDGGQVQSGGTAQHRRRRHGRNIFIVGGGYGYGYGYAPPWAYPYPPGWSASPYAYPPYSYAAYAPATYPVIASRHWFGGWPYNYPYGYGLAWPGAVPA